MRKAGEGVAWLVCQACQWELQVWAQLGLHPVLRPQEGTPDMNPCAQCRGDSLCVLESNREMYSWSLLFQFGCATLNNSVSEYCTGKLLCKNIYEGVFLVPLNIFAMHLYQASFDHVKVGPTPVLALHNLWCQIHMFQDILEFRVDKKKKYLEKTVLVIWSQTCGKMAEIVRKVT